MSDDLLTLAEVKLALHVDQDDEDEFIAGLIVAAQQFVEGACDGLCLTQRTLMQRVALVPLTELTPWPIYDSTDIALTYFDGVAEVVIVDDAWRASFLGVGATSRRVPVLLQPLRAGWGVTMPASGGDQVAIATITAGFKTAEEVPPVLKHAVRMIVAHWYANREAIIAGGSAAAVEPPLAVTASLKPFQVLAI